MGDEGRVAHDAAAPPRSGLTFDVQTRRVADDTALLGGVPFRVLRLSVAGAQRVRGWVAGEPVDATPGSRKLADKLIAAGMAHPTVEPATDLGGIGVVIPVLDDVAGLESALPLLRLALPAAPIVVVDDGSADSSRIDEVATAHGAVVERHPTNQGPSAARNTGRRALARHTVPPSMIAFVDADVTVNGQALRLLKSHLDPTQTAIAAPRIVAKPEPGVHHAYEQTNSPLDMGPDPALVRPHTRVSYVPSAMMLIRVDVLEVLAGFDESMRVGEDVDFVWRAVDAGYDVRYEPRAVAIHRNRRTVWSAARQRFAYGTSAALLEARHPNHVFPVELSTLQLAIWLSAVFGRRRGAVLAGLGFAASVVEFERKLNPVIDDAAPVAAAVLIDAHRRGLRWLANAMTRGWFPLLLWGRRPRRALAAALLIPAAADYNSARDQDALTNPVAFVALRIVDHAAYAAGLWAGAWQQRSIRALLPHFRRR